MTAREWKPGDVAAVTAYGGAVPAVRVAGCTESDHQYGSRGPHWHYLSKQANGSTWTSNPDAAARPLVVIDPEDREQVEQLRNLWDDAHEDQQGHKPSLSAKGARGNALQAALREFADPKPPEPEDRPIVHAVMYRDYKIGSLCDSGAWGAATLFSMVTDDVTCPGCRSKLDGTPKATS